MSFPQPPPEPAPAPSDRSASLRASAEEEVRRVIDASIGWAQTKDFDLLYRIFGDEKLFIFHPDSASTVTSLDEFRKLTEIWANPAFRATGHEIRDLRIRLAESGTVAWFSCLLDDFGEWDERPIGWTNVRWTGVLEKHGAQWTVAQMHFSFPTERMQEKAERREEKGGVE